MSRNQDCQSVRGVNSRHITVAGDVLQHDDNIYENPSILSNQEISLGNTKSSKKKLSKLQIVVIVAIILNFALAVGSIAIVFLKGNEILDQHQKLESEHNAIESLIKAKEKQLSQLQDENTELKRNLTAMESRLTRLEDENTEIYRNATTQLTMIRNAQSGVNSYLIARINGITSSNNVSNEIIRLAAGGTNYGRVEIFYNGKWGTVCDDFWDANDATVVCRMLGYLGPATAYSRAHYGAGTGQIWLDDVSCRGDEIAIWNCTRESWGTHNCGHREDASVHCDK